VWVPKLVRRGDLRFRAGRAARFGRCEDRRVTRFWCLVRLAIDVLVLRGRRDRSKDVEILVLRHQLAVLRRHHARADLPAAQGQPHKTLSCSAISGTGKSVAIVEAVFRRDGCACETAVSGAGASLSCVSIRRSR
jgi:hypothetical protein